MSDSKFLLINSDVLPDVFQRVVEAKRLLISGKAKSSTEAAKLSGISRSAFYKYKDFVFGYNERTGGKIITINAVLKDTAGVLSIVMSELYILGANILTVNQSIPIGEVASVSLTLRTDMLKTGVDELVESIRRLDGVVSINQIIGD